MANFEKIKKTIYASNSTVEMIHNPICKEAFLDICDYIEKNDIHDAIRAKYDGDKNDGIVIIMISHWLCSPEECMTYYRDLTKILMKGLNL